MLKYSQETLKKTVPVDIWIQDCFHVLYLTNIFLVHLLETVSTLKEKISINLIRLFSLYQRFLDLN